MAAPKATVILFVVVYVSFLQPIFAMTSLNLMQFGVATGLTLIPSVAGELSKQLKGVTGFDFYIINILFIYFL